MKYEDIHYKQKAEKKSRIGEAFTNARVWIMIFICIVFYLVEPDP